MGPAGAAVGLVEHEQLGAVQVRDHRQPRGHPRQRLVHRGQVVQVRHLDAVEHPRGAEDRRPLVGEVVGVTIVERGHDPVGGAGPVLE